jgi:nucleoside-diphosphate-sugar epimerase
MKIIENPRGVASGQIYNIGNPRNNFSVRQLAEMMVELALEIPEYEKAARKVRLKRTTAERYYGRGYQDMQNRVPKIDNTKRDLRWRPRVGMRDALRRIFEAYRTEIAQARHLVV